MPLTTDPRQSMLLNLGGQEVALEVWWAPLPGLWYLTIDVNGTRVAGGRQVVSRSRLIRDHRFSGDLFVVPPTGESEATAPGRLDWGAGRYRLVYVAAADDEGLDRFL